MLGSLYQVSDKLRDRLRARRWTPEQATGRRGEDLAHRFLQRAGFIIVARNYRIPAGFGEIDLVAWENDKLVIVEVKTRHTDEYGPPDRAIDHDKKQSLLRAARDYARHADAPWDRVRFDVVSVLLTTPPDITHFRDVMSSL